MNAIIMKILMLSVVTPMEPLQEIYRYNFLEEIILFKPIFQLLTVQCC
jgi:hypothetical protein